VDSAVTSQQLEDSLDDLASGVEAATKLGQALEAEAALAVAELALAEAEAAAAAGGETEAEAREGMRVAALRTTLAAVEGATRQLTWAYTQVGPRSLIRTGPAPVASQEGC
jgi:hypothetical protein